MQNQDNSINATQDQPTSDTVSLFIDQWVTKVKNHSQLITDSRKQMEHWQKRELDSAIICGEYLVKIRKTFGKQGAGFKPFIEQSFSNEFCYKTALRYMKLYNDRNNIPSEIRKLRKAYIHLGILKEDFQYPKDPSETTQEPGSDANKSEPVSSNDDKIDPASSKSTPESEPTPYGNFITIEFRDPNNPKDSYPTKFDFVVNVDGQMLHRLAGATVKPKEMTPKATDWLYNYIKPFVEWHNRITQAENIFSLSGHSPFENQKIAA